MFNKVSNKKLTLICPVLVFFLSINQLNAFSLKSVFSLFTKTDTTTKTKQFSVTTPYISKKSIVCISVVCVAIAVAVGIFLFLQSYTGKKNNENINNTEKVGKISKFKYLLNCVKIIFSGLSIDEACLYEDFGLLKIMIENGTDLNQKDKLLSIACRSGRMEIVRLLVNNGIDVNKIGTYEYKTPLYCALKRKDDEMVKFLISKGANVDQVNDRGETQLFCAIYFHDYDIAQKLILLGANVDKERYDGKTPLHEACISGRLEIVESLMESGADPNIVCRDDKTPLQALQPFDSTTNYDKIIINLVENGAKLGFLGDTFLGSWENFVKGYVTSQNHLKINVLLDKITISRNDLLDLIIFINDKKTATYDKQSALIGLLAALKYLNISIETISIEKLLRQIPFNNRFLNDNEFMEVREYAIKNNLKDKHNRSVFQASIIFSKDKNATFKLLVDAYNSYSYSSDIQQKIELRDDLEKILEYTKKRNKIMHAMLSNIDIIWDDLRTKNLLRKTNKKNKWRLEPALVRDIMEFIGIDGIKKDNIYYSGVN